MSDAALSGDLDFSIPLHVIWQHAKSRISSFICGSKVLVLLEDQDNLVKEEVTISVNDCGSLKGE